MIAAQREAAGYDFPPEVATRDAALIEELGSVRAVVKYYHDLSKDSRLNEHSVKALYGEFPEYDRLYNIATDGMIIDTPSLDWEPNGAVKMPFRKSHKMISMGETESNHDNEEQYDTCN